MVSEHVPENRIEVLTHLVSQVGVLSAQQLDLPLQRGNGRLMGILLQHTSTLERHRTCRAVHCMNSWRQRNRQDQREALPVGTRTCTTGRLRMFLARVA